MTLLTEKEKEKIYKNNVKDDGETYEFDATNAIDETELATLRAVAKWIRKKETADNRYSGKEGYVISEKNLKELEA